MTYKQRIVSNYKGVIEEWKVALILAIAKKRGVPKDEWEDVVQELILDVKKFQYDAANEAGATEATAIAAVIERRIIDMFRSKKREQKMMRKFQQLREVNTDSVDAHEETIDLPLDVITALETLKPTEYKVCALLMKGKTSEYIAKRLKWTWRKMDSVTSHIGHQFTKHNLGHYVGVFNNE